MRPEWFVCACSIGVACGGVSARGGDPTTGPPSDSGAPPAAADAAGDSPAARDSEANADVAVVTLGGVTVAPSGQASGDLNGYTWVSLAPGATGTTRRDTGQLCLQGTIAAVTCTPNTAVMADACNWSSNWGVDLGFDTNSPKAAWGQAAPTLLAVKFSGSPGTYNLLAHVAGDPDAQWYGIPNYASGQFVSASSLTLQYWNTPPSTALGTFQSVDMLAIFLDAEPTNVAYDFCITGIATR